MVICNRKFRCCTSTSWREKHLNFPTLVTWRSFITSRAKALAGDTAGQGAGPRGGAVGGKWLWIPGPHVCVKIKTLKNTMCLIIGFAITMCRDFGLPDQYCVFPWHYIHVTVIAAVLDMEKNGEHKDGALRTMVGINRQGHNMGQVVRLTRAVRPSEARSRRIKS